MIVQDQDQVMELKGQIILPGFVNGHNHMYGFLSHGITADAMVTEFESFLDDFWWPYVEDCINHKLVEATTTWACVEMIDSGVTSFVDILEGPNSIPGVLEVERKIVEKSGLRGRLSFEACERMSKENGQLGLQENIEFVKKHNHPGELVQGLNSIHTLFTCSGIHAGAALWAPGDGSIPMNDEIGMKNVKILGEKMAVMTKIMKNAEI